MRSVRLRKGVFARASVAREGGASGLSVVLSGVSFLRIHVIEMVKGVKPLAHGHALLPLGTDFFGAQRL